MWDRDAVLALHLDSSFVVCVVGTYLLLDIFVEWPRTATYSVLNKTHKYITLNKLRGFAAEGKMWGKTKQSR